MSKILLSICIPVYNFGTFISETLESIIKQATNEVEIVVVDGASTDNTTDIVRGFQARYAGLRYYRLEKKGGIDYDMAKSVELARGKYCWLFGGDDIMLPNALPKMLRQISEGHDVCLCESILCRFDMTPIAKHTMFKLKEEQVFDLSREEEREEYFRNALNTAAFFSFCSALVFNKSRWDAIKPDDQFMGSCWAHAARLLRMMPDGLKVKYLPEPYLYKRCDNDSFLDKGLVNRFRIAIDGYNRIAEFIFGRESIEGFHIRRALRNEHKVRNLLRAKLICHEEGLHHDMKILESLASMLYIDPILLNRINFLAFKLTPIWVLKCIRPIYIYIQKYI